MLCHVIRLTDSVTTKQRRMETVTYDFIMSAIWEEYFNDDFSSIFKLQDGENSTEL